jgi:hypothetical protein
MPEAVGVGITLVEQAHPAASCMIFILNKIILTTGHEDNLTGQSITEFGQRGWFYLRIDSVFVTNYVKTTESDLLNISEVAQRFGTIVEAGWTILDWRLRGARPIAEKPRI